jgi:hypothetical protein
MKKIDPHWKIFITLVGVTIVFWIGAAVISKWFDFVITSENIALTFIGVLATFVVVSNYAQIIELKREFKRGLNKYKGILDKEFDEKIKNLENKTVAMIVVSEANAIKNSNSERAFRLFFKALRLALIVAPIDGSIKMCIKEINHLIDSEKVKLLQLYQREKDNMIEDLDKVDSTIKESTEKIRKFLDSCKIDDIS